MKTIEQKAEAYDKALDRAKKWYNAPNIDKMPTYGNRIIEEIFPELIEENEDEKIRKELIKFVKVNIPNEERYIAWLEKQGNPTEINPSEFDLRLNKLLKQFETLPKEELASSLSFYLNVVQNDGTYREEKQGEQNPIMAKSPQLGEQKPANNNELKFKVGDWVVVDGITQKVTHIQAEGFDTDRAWNGKSTFKDVHLWTIADVKDGNVLVDVYGNIGIYKSHDDFSWLSYCSLGYYGGFQHFTIEHDNEKTHPATKEQRDLLFTKMKEAGYEWDAEKKELRKISQRMISAEAKEAMYGKPTAWSEEDTFMYNKIRNLLTDISLAPESRNSLFDWLKSLEDRYTWKPSDEQMNALQTAIGIVGELTPTASLLKEIREQLRKLR